MATIMTTAATAPATAALKVHPLDFPASNRIEPGSVDIQPRPFPPSVRSESVNANAIAESTVDAFNSALKSQNSGAISELFLPDGYWKDHLCLSWDLQTLKKREQIVNVLSGEGNGRLKEIKIDRSTAYRSPRIANFDALGEVKCLQFFVMLTAEAGPGRGIVRMTEVDGKWLISTFFTSLLEISGHEQPLHHRRMKGVEHKGVQDGKNWRERREAAMNLEGIDPLVVIIGAGQAGLAAAARLKMLGILTLVVDKNARIGDSWRQRYHQLVLHDPVWYDHMPYINFPSYWPVFTPKDKIADFFEAYASLLELDVWTSTNLASSSWDDDEMHWTITLRRCKPDGTTDTRTLHPRHIVQATGHSGKKNFPIIKGMDSFKGDRLCHSSEFPGANPESRGKRAVVVGSCNSGHDIAQDFYSKGYDVTMVQRSSTCVISSEAVTEIGLAGLYDENGPPVEDADIWLHSIPAEIFKSHQQGVTKLQNAKDEAILRGLEEADFKLDMGPHGAGLFMKYHQRGGGYYIDVGASQLIIDGRIKVKQGQEISEVLPDGLLFADGTVLQADEVVFATGYQNMRTEARGIFGDELADRIADVWGYDGKGEIRAMWKRTGHPGFWFMGGNLAMCRYFSMMLALQIKAAELGLNKL